jgi:hypothetical protein
MNRYFLTYDLNGPRPTHAEMDKHIGRVATEYARVLETVWYFTSPFDLEQVYHRLNEALSLNDRILVVEAKNAFFRNLLVRNEALQQSWQKAA